MLGLLRFLFFFFFLRTFNLVICILGFFYFIWTLKYSIIAFYLFNIWKKYTLSLYFIIHVKDLIPLKKRFLASLHGCGSYFPQTGIERATSSESMESLPLNHLEIPFSIFSSVFLSLLLNIFNKNTFGLVVSPYCNFVLCLDFALIIVFFLLLHLGFISSNFSFFIFNFLWCKLGFVLCFVLFHL